MLIFIGILLFFLFCCVTVYRLEFGLIISLCVIYNPVFNFYMLNLADFRGGSVRAGISVCCIFVLVLSIFIRYMFTSSLTRDKTPIDILLILFLPCLLLSVLVAIFFGNEYREIFSEIVPFIEGGSFFFITGFIVKKQCQLNRVLRWIFYWLTLNFIIEVILYFIFWPRYYFRVDFGGLLLSRLVDFMVAIFWPIFLTYYLYTVKNIQKIFLGLSVLIGFVVIFLGFFRTVWLSVISICMFVCVMTAMDSKHSLKNIIYLSCILLISIPVLTSLFANFTSFSNLNIVSLLKDRVSAQQLHEGSSYSGRLSSYVALATGALEKPLLGNGFGAKFAGGLPVSSSPNFFLNTLYEMGFISFLYLCFIYLFLMLILYRIWKQTNNLELKKMSLGILSGLLSLLVILNLFPCLLHFPLAPYMAVSIALVFIQRKLYHNPNLGISESVST